jgi:hypothetical protein
MSTLTYNAAIILAVKLDRGKANLAAHLMKLARKASDLTEFKRECKLAEIFIMSEDAGDYQVADVPQCWKQYTSDIAAGMKLELDPKRFDSFNAFRDAKIEENKKVKAARLAEAVTSRWLKRLRMVMWSTPSRPRRTPFRPIYGSWLSSWH